MTSQYNLSQIGQTYAQTAAEISAGVTPSNYGYQPGDVRRYGADSTGATDSASAINSAILVAKTAYGGTVTFAPGTYVCATQLTMGVVQGVRLVGLSSNNQLTGGATIKYTGTTSPFISVSGSAASLSIENLNIIYSSGSFTGTLIAAPVNQLYLINSMLSGLSVSSAQYLLDINSSVDVCISHTAFSNAQYGISGQKSDGTGFCNVVAISQSQFTALTTSGIRNPGQGWAITGCDFENLANNKGSAIVMDAACTAIGVSVSGCWFGDATDASAWVWILWQGSGLSVNGCYFNGVGTNNPDAIKLLGTSYGLTVNSCYFSHFANAINLGSFLSNASSLTGNRFSGCTTNIAGTPVSDHFSYQSNTWTPTPSNLTVVLGGGTVSYAGYYEKRGTYVYFSIVVSTTGGATTAATAGSTSFTLPFTATSGSGTYGTCAAASPNTALAVGTGGFVGGAGIWPPTWAATSNAIVITGSYQTTTL